MRSDTVSSLSTGFTSISLVAFRQNKIKSLIGRITCNGCRSSAAGRYGAYGKRICRSCCTLCTVSSLSASLSGISFFALLAFGDTECKGEHFCCVLTGSCYSDSRILSGLQGRSRCNWCTETSCSSVFSSERNSLRPVAGCVRLLDVQVTGIRSQEREPFGLCVVRRLLGQ